MGFQPLFRSHLPRWGHVLGKQQRFSLIALVAIGLIFLGSVPVRAATPRHYTELTFPALPEIQLPDYERFQLDNGLVVYLMENHELPLVAGTVMIHTGSRFDPPDKVGLADVTGTVIRAGGTQSHDANTLNRLLEQRAAAVEVSVGQAMGSARFSALSEDLESVFGLFAEVLQSPRFPQDQIDLALSQGRGAISRRNDTPDSISGREFPKLIYGADSPFARTQEYETLAAITRTDLVQFYQTYFHPDQMILGIVGDFEPRGMKQLIQAQFGDWPASSTPLAETPPPVVPRSPGGVFLVEQPQLTQSTVQLGHLGVRLDDPDMFALYVINEALNSFGGRLFDEVRSRQGLAYSVYALWRPQYDYPGLFVGGGQTRSETTVAFIEAVKAEFEKLRTTPISEQELQQAKDSILNSFVFNFQDPAQTLVRLMRYEYFDYPDDYIFQYQRAVKAMTANQVLQAAQAHLHPDQLVTLVVGNPQTMQPDLTALQGTVTPVKLQPTS
ncbi:insulinase family protein [Synechococcales cyanobacterium C]|uniref:Insulinase family protein n=1 Tax=Petrachloros mirabilis ULC683 TaxID=2781853 RepID=A0A8K1ZZJ8_9CYAN|nr:pitrilysin family protein [Petrachloros mirabilis]NCJ07017.1 insulinase family protein [Petrachloros mirabilis ULC683]